MAKRKTKTTVKPVQSDATFFLKLAMYLIIASFWLRLQHSDGSELPVPAGAVIALMFASHEHFKIDRKIEFALILLGMFIAFWLPIGLYVSL